MELLTISQLSKDFGISTRMLRYYEEIGLIESRRIEDYAYRVYDEAAVRRLQQIIILRKLRIPLKQISAICNNGDGATLLDVFTKSLKEINEELMALSTMRLIFLNFIDELEKRASISLDAMLFSDDAILGAINSLSLTKINFKEDKQMDELNKANEKLTELKNVRIIYLPPCTVAASHYFGENPELNSGNMLKEFIRNSELYKIKPDFRVYGFNNPSPVGAEAYGYEFWATVPEDMEVPEPLKKKHFAGGLYAAHCIKMGDFHEWQLLANWLEGSEEYCFDAREPLGMGGCIEEQLNVFSQYSGSNEASQNVQLDLLMPVKKKG